MAIEAGDGEAVRRAAQALADGELVGFPTETVYGLGARADDDAAVAKIFAAKGRPADHPLIVHVADAAAASHFAAAMPPAARRLIDAFWPGPLTVIVPRREGVATAAAAGQATVGLRCPSHPVARALLAAAAERGVNGVAAPSANRFGRVSPTRADHVRDEFGAGLLVLDGGDCEQGIESTIVDCSRGAAVLLRPGTLPRERIEAALGEPLRAADADAPRASGTLEAHYAPNAKLRMMTPALLSAALGVLGTEPIRLALYSRTVHAARGSSVVERRMPADAAGAAHDLYAALRELDAQGVALIWVEEPPTSPEWDGVRDRLTRAAAAH